MSTLFYIYYIEKNKTFTFYCKKKLIYVKILSYIRRKRIMTNSDNLEFQIIDFALKSDNEEIKTIMEKVLSK